MAETPLKCQSEETPIEVHPHVGQAVTFGVSDDKHAKKDLGAAMIGHDINISLPLEATDVGMATCVSIKEGYDTKEINVVSGEDNSEDVIEAAETEITIGSDTNELSNIEAGDAHPMEDNREDVATVGDLWKKMGPDCVWASGCTLTAIAAAAGLPIFGHRFTPAYPQSIALKKCLEFIQFIV